MFLSRNGLKKLMTEAYKGYGLKVRNDGEGLAITGATWSVYFIRATMPKEVLGDLIGLVGELPKKGECYESTRDGNQGSMVDVLGVVSAMDPETSAGGCLERIPLTLNNGKDVAILQSPVINPYTNYPDTVLVDRYKAGLINLRELDEENDEEPPQGPFTGNAFVENRFYAVATWYNNRMAYSIGREEPLDDYARDVVNILAAHRLWRSPRARAAEVEE